MPGRVPNIFVSSTFFDLKDVRAELSRFLEEDLGYRGLLFEQHSFPVEPDSDAVENCRWRVQEDADVLVLVIGGRYGCIPDDRHRSITNVEYLAARAKGIPIYAFIQRAVLDAYEQWKRDPTVDVSHVADSIELLEFVDQVRSVDSVWTFAFVETKDIISALRLQLAYQMMRGLHLLRQLRQEDPGIVALSGPALQLVLEKPPGWHGLLFAQVVDDEVHRYEDQSRMHKIAVAFGPGEFVPDEMMPNWLSGRLHDPARHARGLTRLVNEALTQSLNSGDARATISHARLIGSAYKELLDWARRIRSTYAGDDWQPIMEAVAKMCDDMIAKLEGLGSAVRREIEQALATPSASGETRKVTVHLTMNVANQEEFDLQLARLKERRGLQ